MQIDRFSGGRIQEGEQRLTEARFRDSIAMIPLKGSVPMLKRFKNIKRTVLLAHIPVTLAYPLYKAFTSENRLLVFSDVLTIVAMILLIAGVIYSLVLHGDFDIAGFALKRGIRSKEQQTYAAYRQDKQEKHGSAFNYPLFLGLVYLAVSAFIAYAVL